MELRRLRPLAAAWVPDIASPVKKGVRDGQQQDSLVMDLCRVEKKKTAPSPDEYRLSLFLTHPDKAARPVDRLGGSVMV